MASIEDVVDPAVRWAMSVPGALGNLASMPGDYYRGFVGGHPGERLSSQDLLRQNLGQDNPIANNSLVGALYDAGTDPLALTGALPELGGAAKALWKGGEAAKANPILNSISEFAKDKSGTLHLPFDFVKHPSDVGLTRSDPEWVNNRTFYHGTSNPGLMAEELDPMKTDPGGLFGRGIYTTDEGGKIDPGITVGYANARYGEGYPFFDELSKSMPRSKQELALVFPKLREIMQARLNELGGSVPQGRISTNNAERWMDISRSRGNPEWRVLDFPKVFHGLFEPGPGSQKQVGDALRRVGIRTPQHTSPTIYQAQSDYGRILDAEVPMHHYKGLPNAIRKNATEIATETGNEGALKELHESMNTPNATLDSIRDPLVASLIDYHPDNEFDNLINLLKGQGFDAITHTGGLLTPTGAKIGPHQVVIGLDPNGFLGGKETPYKQWEPWASSRDWRNTNP